MNLKNLSVKTKIPKILSEKLKNKKILQIYKNFEKSLDIKKDFIVAVSGGPDSLALAFLAKIYAYRNKVKSKFCMVDHKLRNNSTNEAKLVKKILSKYSISLDILTWRGKKPTKNIQSLARKKRYELLFSFCKKYKIKDILLGHHQDDQLENFFIRILRGSGLKGLVSLDKKNIINSISLLRPLISLKKEDLIFISNYVFNFYIKDPSNLDEKFRRVIIRKLIGDLKENGLETKKFLKTIDNLKHSDNAITFYTKENLIKNTSFFPKKNQLILNSNFFEQPYEIIFRTLSNAIQFIGKKYYPSRGKKLDKIIKDVKNNSLYKSTLGGCIVKKVNHSVIISKER